MTEKLNFVLGRVENIVGKGENAAYQGHKRQDCVVKSGKESIYTGCSALWVKFCSKHNVMVLIKDEFACHTNPSICECFVY